MDSLVSLFREQMALLNQQGEILKAQAASSQPPTPVVPEPSVPTTTTTTTPDPPTGTAT